LKTLSIILLPKSARVRNRMPPSAFGHRWRCWLWSAGVFSRAVVVQINAASSVIVILTLSWATRRGSGRTCFFKTRSAIFAGKCNKFWLT